MNDSNYNKRLFSKGMRRKFHIARFKWLGDMVARYKMDTSKVIELGCFDGRSIKYLNPKPFTYAGYDANWENGLDIARANYSSNKEFVFYECNFPHHFNENGELHTLAISLETLEHIPVEVLDDYLKKISVGLNGYFIVTVPNEKGVLFLIKYILKRFFYGGYDRYSISELINATLGRMKYVERNQHKGFDYVALRSHLKNYFELVEEQGIPFSYLPLWMNTQVGFVLKSGELSVGKN